MQIFNNFSRNRFALLRTFVKCPGIEIPDKYIIYIVFQCFDISIKSQYLRQLHADIVVFIGGTVAAGQKIDRIPPVDYRFYFFKCLAHKTPSFLSLPASIFLFIFDILTCPVINANNIPTPITDKIVVYRSRLLE